MKGGGLQPDSFHDLLVWREARQLFLRVLAVADTASRGGAVGIVETLVHLTLGPPQRIAAGFSRGRPRRFLRDLEEAADDVVRLQAVLHLAREAGILGPADAGEVETRAAALLKAIREHRRYLVNREISRRQRYLEGE